MEMVQNDQGVLGVLPRRREKPFGPIAGHHFYFGPLLLTKCLIEGVKDTLAVLVVIPDDDALLNVHHVGDVRVTFLPGYLINAHGLGCRWWHKQIIRFLLEGSPIKPVYHLVIETEEPAGLGIGSNGGKSVHLLGKALGEAALQP